MTLRAEGPRSHWQGSAAAPLGPELTGEATADLCVVGLGGSGLTAIHEALDLGLSVVGLEARTVAAGAAGRNGGLLLAGMRDFYHDACAALGRERAAAIYRATQAEMTRIASSAPGAVHIGGGSLRVAKDGEEWDDCRAQMEAMGRDDLAVTERETDFGQALFFPGDGWCDPYRRCLTLAEGAVRRGARLFERSPALDLNAEWVVTPRGVCKAKRVIVCVDGGLERLVPEFEGRVRTARLQMLSTEPAHDVQIPQPMYQRYGYEYVVQDADGCLAVGGFRDRFEEDEWTTDASPTAGVQSALDEFLRSTLGTTAAVARRWAASVGYVEGPLPLFEETRGGALAVGGYSGTGNVIGALLGRAAVRLAAGRPDETVELFGGPSSRY